MACKHRRRRAGYVGLNINTVFWLCIFFLAATCCYHTQIVFSTYEVELKTFEHAQDRHFRKRHRKFRKGRRPIRSDKNEKWRDPNDRHQTPLQKKSIPRHPLTATKRSTLVSVVTSSQITEDRKCTLCIGECLMFRIHASKGSTGSGRSLDRRIDVGGGQQQEENDNIKVFLGNLFKGVTTLYSYFIITLGVTFGLGMGLNIMGYGYQFRDQNGTPKYQVEYQLNVTL